MILADRTNVALAQLDHLRLSYSTYSRMTTDEIAAYNAAIDTVQELLHNALMESKRKSLDLKPRIRTIYDLICDCGDDPQWVAYSYCAGVMEKLLK